MAKATKGKKRKTPTGSRKAPQSGTIPQAEFLELVVIRILAAEVKQNVTRGLPDKLASNVNINVTEDPTAQQINGIFECTMRGLYSDQAEPTDPKDSPIYIRAVLHAAYRKKPGHEFTTDDLQLFGRSVGLLNIWPYWREFVQSMTPRMGQPTLTLPLIQLGNVGVVVAPGQKPGARKRKA